MNASAMDTQTYGTISEAISAFQCLSGMFLTGNDRRFVAGLIEENRLSVRFVADLANDVIAALADPAPVIPACVCPVCGQASCSGAVSQPRVFALPHV